MSSELGLEFNCHELDTIITLIFVFLMSITLSHFRVHFTTYTLIVSDGTHRIGRSRVFVLITWLDEKRHDVKCIK